MRRRFWFLPGLVLAAAGIAVLVLMPVTTPIGSPCSSGPNTSVPSAPCVNGEKIDLTGPVLLLAGVVWTGVVALARPAK